MRHGDRTQPANFFTLGYQLHTIRSMLRVLKANQVEVLVDVRENPVSRKPGFSKSRLEAELSRAGVDYVHFQCLGNPSSIRSRYCRNGQIRRALKEYERYLLAKQDCVQSLIEAVSSRRFCLLCLEKDHNSCHRSVIARRLTELTKCQPIHLT